MPRSAPMPASPDGCCVVCGRALKPHQRVFCGMACTEARINPPPTEQEIAERCAAICATWSESTEASRTVAARRAWMPPLIDGTAQQPRSLNL